MKLRKYNFNDGKTLELGDRTLVMGILNATPDSFSDGGKYNTPEAAIKQVVQLIADGADLIDVGFESTRPGHVQISVAEELNRMKEILPNIVAASKVPLSIDTYRAETADYALTQGVNTLNDIWGLRYDREIAQVAARHNVPVVIMHNQKEEQYGDIIEDMKAFFFRSIDIAIKAGIHPYNIWLDPGIGFGKNFQQNMEVMHRLVELTIFEYPLLLGTSRKRFIGTLLNDLPFLERDEGTIATCVFGSFTGADIVRVHNVKMVKRAMQVADALIKGV